MFKKMLFISGLLLVATIGWNLNTEFAHAAASHSPGTLIVNNGAVYQIDSSGSKRLPFDSAEKFFSHRLSYDRVVPANAADMALPEGASPEWGDGVLFTDNGVIYQVSNGKKHGFTSAEVYLGQGFRFDMARSGNLSKLDNGPAVDSADAKHLTGTLLNSEGTIWTIDSGLPKAFPSEAIFFSHGGTYTQVVNANKNDTQTTFGIMDFKLGSLVNDAGTVWVVNSQEKHVFPNVACFIGFGFNFSYVFNGSTNAFESAGSVCADNTTTPNAGVAAYTKQYVVGNPGQFEVRMETFDLSSGKVRVITDTAYDQDCNATCPTTSLKSFADANGAQYGMNGTYFCPDDYSECRSIANSFFWKIIDTKAGIMINERSGLGENDPFLTFDSVGQPKYFSKWIDYKNSNFQATAGINSPSLIENGQISLDVAKLDANQKNARSTRGAIAVKGTTLYLLQVYGATVPDSANVLKTLGVDHALVMDGGGSNALLYEGVYKIGPGRTIPNAILVQILP